ncbi:MAG: MerR family copper efflux transcriptional regulator [Bradymonadia bacterium]
MAEQMRIGELARLTQKSIRALHLYEERGLIAPAARSKGGYRLYETQHVERVRYIDRLQGLGCTLDEIRGMVQRWTQAESAPDGMSGLAEDYRARLQQTRATIDDLERLAAQLETSLAWLGSCHGCTRTDAPTTACSTCDRPIDDGLTLITGLTGRPSR